MPKITARAANGALLVLVLLIGAGNLWATYDEVHASEHKFCAVVGAVTAHPVPKPANPAANPSRENNYLFYVKFVRLGHSLGCR